MNPSKKEVMATELNKIAGFLCIGLGFLFAMVCGFVGFYKYVSV